MLMSKRCPYTNVINFFDEAEPHLAIGSITKCGTSAAADGYTWRFYVSEEALSGHTADAPSAERHLRASQLNARSTRMVTQL
jgi:hypothetical protein